MFRTTMTYRRAALHVGLLRKRAFAFSIFLGTRWSHGAARNDGLTADIEFEFLLSCFPINSTDSFRAFAKVADEGDPFIFQH